MHLRGPAAGVKTSAMSSGQLTIDLDAITANWRALDKRSARQVATGAVVKADGYGLGADDVAGRLARSGVRSFFVATAREGASLRKAVGREPEIIVFAGHCSGDTDLIRLANLTPTLNSPQQVARHLGALPGQAFGVNLDTGMNRLGLKAPEWAEVRAQILATGPKLIMSHLACADEPDHPMNARQLAAFRAMSDGLDVRRSLSATGGILLGPDYHFDLTRPGVGLYGGQPFADASPVVSLSLPVIQTRDVAMGETVGYGNSWTAARASRIATLAAGYADGIFRALAGKVSLYAGRTACPLVGRVSMDLLSVDVTDLDEEPDNLNLICPQQTIDDLARAAGTIGYEILTALGQRYQRRPINT